MASFEIERVYLPDGETSQYSPLYDGNAVQAPAPLAYEEPAEAEAPLPKRAKKPRIPVLLVEAVSIVLMFAMVAGLILSNIRLNEVATEAAKYKKELTLLKDREKKLQSQYNTSLDLKSIEALATDQYAMAPPTSSQIVYVNLIKEDKAEVLNRSGGIFGWLKSLFSPAYNAGTAS